MTANPNRLGCGDPDCEDCAEGRTIALTNEEGRSLSADELARLLVRGEIPQRILDARERAAIFDAKRAEAQTAAPAYDFADALRVKQTPAEDPEHARQRRAFAMNVSAQLLAGGHIRSTDTMLKLAYQIDWFLQGNPRDTFEEGIH